MNLQLKDKTCLVTGSSSGIGKANAKIIAAEGEALSAQKLADAADIIAAHPIALQLRNLQVLNDIAVEKNSTIIFPSQFMDTVASVKDFMAKERA